MALSDEAIMQRLGEAFAAAALPVEQPLDPELELEEIEGIDSISRVRLMMRIEESFAITIPPREGGRIKTVGELRDLIVTKLRHV